MAGGIIGSILGGVFTGGAGPAIGAGIGAAIPSITELAKTLADRLIPDPAQRDAVARDLAVALAAREGALLSAVQAQDQTQGAINLAEAQGNDRYSSRWRPTVGWICTAALGYQFLFAPFVTWAGSLVGVALGFSFPVPPTLVSDDLMPLIYALLGLSASRTVERVNGVSTAVPTTLAKR